MCLAEENTIKLMGYYFFTEYYNLIMSGLAYLFLIL